MNQELIERVKNVLVNPTATIGTLNELKALSLELNNNHVNIGCADCVNDAVVLLTNWIKENNVDIDYRDSRQKALNGDYYLKRINLFVQVYQSENPKRQSELSECERINHAGKLFDRILSITDRLTFRQMFDLSKEYPQDINIFANSDIYFDETIQYSRFMPANDCWVLSRWDVSGGMGILFDRKDSQDVWIFNGAVKELGYADFNFGVAGCDNRIAYELRQAGYRVKNPSKDVHAFHLHESNHRTYDPSNKVPEPYHFVFPHRL